MHMYEVIDIVACSVSVKMSQFLHIYCQYTRRSDCRQKGCPLMINRPVL